MIKRPNKTSLITDINKRYQLVNEQGIYMTSAQRLKLIKTHVNFREMGGSWLRQKREQITKPNGKQLTQHDIANIIGISSSGYISAIESGGPSVPEDRWDDYADALHIERELFRRNMVMFYLPKTYSAFAGEPTKEQLKNGLLK
ncbi:MAG: helix-turn-helix domain-containing protein [Rhodospirillales bacterium]